eukprot:366478-Chlamydomonas_euryale.AAC.12
MWTTAMGYEAATACHVSIASSRDAVLVSIDMQGGGPPGMDGLAWRWGSTRAWMPACIHACLCPLSADHAPTNL